MMLKPTSSFSLSNSAVVSKLCTPCTFPPFKFLLRHQRRSHLLMMFSAASETTDVYSVARRSELLFVCKLPQCMTCCCVCVPSRLPSSAKQPVLQPLPLPGAPGAPAALPAPALRFTQRSVAVSNGGRQRRRCKRNPPPHAYSYTSSSLQR